MHYLDKDYNKLSAKGKLEFWEINFDSTGPYSLVGIWEEYSTKKGKKVGNNILFLNDFLETLKELDFYLWEEVFYAIEELDPPYYTRAYEFFTYLRYLLLA